MNKVIDKGFRNCRFVSTIVKHPVVILCFERQYPPKIVIHLKSNRPPNFWAGYATAALSKCCLCNDMKQLTFLNTLNWYCVKWTCFGISSSGSANSNASKAVRSLYTATHTQSCFVIFCFMERGHSVQSRSFCFAVLA